MTALRVGGRNLLTGPEIDAGNFGSTFWTSPQSAWGWPPVPEVDHAAYRASIEDSAIVMRSAPSASLGVEIEKQLLRRSGARRRAVRVPHPQPGPGADPDRALADHPGRAGRPDVLPLGRGGLPALEPRRARRARRHLVRLRQGVDHRAPEALRRRPRRVAGPRRRRRAAGEDLPGGPARGARARRGADRESTPARRTPTSRWRRREPTRSVAPGAALTWQVVWLARRLPRNLSVSVGSAALLAHVRALVAADVAAR